MPLMGRFSRHDLQLRLTPHVSAGRTRPVLEHLRDMEALPRNEQARMAEWLARNAHEAALVALERGQWVCDFRGMVAVHAANRGLVELTRRFLDPSSKVLRQMARTLDRPGFGKEAGHVKVLGFLLPQWKVHKVNIAGVLGAVLYSLHDSSHEHRVHAKACLSLLLEDMSVDAMLKSTVLTYTEPHAVMHCHALGEFLEEAVQDQDFLARQAKHPRVRSGRWQEVLPQEGYACRALMAGAVLQAATALKTTRRASRRL